MSTTTTGTGGAAAREMPLIHRIFRHQFSEVRALVTEMGPADPARVRAVGDHLSFMLDALHYHHTTEDDYVWPHLRDRAGIDGRLATRMEEQHREIDVAVARVREASAAWTAAPSPQCADVLVSRLDEFMQVVVTHLDEEERDVVPLIDRHLTEAEWELLGRRGFEKFTPQQRWIAMGQMLEVATQEEATMMLGTLPLPVRVLWRMMGRRKYRRYVEPIRRGRVMTTVTDHGSAQGRRPRPAATAANPSAAVGWTGGSWRMPAWVWLSLAAMTVAMLHILLDFGVGLFPMTGQLSPAVTAMVTLIALIHLWWAVSLVSGSHGNGSGVASATILGLGWTLLANGLAIQYCPPPCPEASPLSDIAHVGSLVFGLTAPAAAIWTLWHRRVRPGVVLPLGAVALVVATIVALANSVPT